MHNQERPLPFNRFRTTVSIEEVDESWALELINEAEREEIIRVEGAQIEGVKIESSDLNCETSEQEPTEPDYTVEAVTTGPTAIDLQRLNWTPGSKRIPLNAEPIRAEDATFRLYLKRLLRA